MKLTIQQTTIGTAATQTVNARDLHASLEIGKDFSNWIKAQIKRADLTEGVDYVVVAQKGVNPQGGRPSDEYHLTIEAGKNIAMLSGTAKGKEVRAYFIECERKAKAAAIQSPAQLLVSMAQQFLAYEQEQQRQSTELARLQENVAVIEARTQPENNFYTVLGYSNLMGAPIDFNTASKLGKKCAELSRQRGMVIGDVSDPRFGRVHSYHVSVLQKVINQVAGAANA